MTIANKLTISRLFVIPIMIAVLYIEAFSSEELFLKMSIAQTIFAIMFVLAAFTDVLDGHLARRRGEVTTFGKFLDPLADKVLVFVALLYLMTIHPDRVPLWAVSLIIFREFAVTGIRLLAVDKGLVIGASIYGKMKTFATMLAIFIMLFNDFGLPVLIGDMTFYVAVVLTAISGFEYLYHTRHIIFESM
jgi:CDP-diacylglycerol---glycerol-3-phosphate 3-phosphatidyltransferase